MASVWRHSRRSASRWRPSPPSRRRLPRWRRPARSSPGRAARPRPTVPGSRRDVARRRHHLSDDLAQLQVHRLDRPQQVRHLVASRRDHVLGQVAGPRRSGRRRPPWTGRGRSRAPATTPWRGRGALRRSQHRPGSCGSSRSRLRIAHEAVGHALLVAAQLAHLFEDRPAGSVNGPT